jgi:hypothetical protein
MGWTFNDLLAKEALPLDKTLVLRHRPTDPKFRKVLPWIAVENPAAYNAHQQNQSQQTEAKFKKAQYLASFIGLESGQAVFVGLYQLAGWKPITVDESRQLPAVKELFDLGMPSIGGDPQRPEFIWFDLQLMPGFYSDWLGKLVIGWPEPAIAWVRKADTNVFPIIAVHQDNVFTAKPKSWRKLILTWSELKVMPVQLKAQIKEWRGIYYIYDTKTLKGYVGSAYGEWNILNRWQNYAETGHGGNRLLKDLDPIHFRFSILERMSQDASIEEVVALENTWKERLHTRAPFGLNDN